jgi:hypothetical protein
MNLLDRLRSEREGDARPPAQPSLLQQLQSQRQPQTAQPSIPEGTTLVGTFADNGRVYQRPDGSLGAVSAGASTSDPATIEVIMAGGTFADAMQNRLDEERIAANPFAARANEFIRGTPFIGSYADEAVGLFSPQAAQNMRASTEAMQRQNPGQTMALNVLGGITTGIPMAIAAAPSVVARAPATIGGRALAGLGLGAGAGATEGAIYGYGEGQTPEERQRNALSGGVVGGVAGGALGAALPYLGAAVGAGVNRIRNTDIGAISGALSVGRPAATEIRNALRQADPIDAQQALARAGDDAMLADAGLAANRLLDASAQTGGPAGEIAVRAVRERTQQATRDMTAALNQSLGAPRGERELMREIRQSTGPQRNDAYRLAYDTPIRYDRPEGQAIEELLDRLPRQTVLRAVSEANDRIRFDGAPQNQILARIGDDGNVTYQEMPNVMQLDYMKRAFDAIARDGTDPITGKMTSDARFASQIAREIRDATRAAVPAYGDALNIAADQLSRERATDVGRRLFAMNRDQVAAELGNATAAERRAAQEGVRSYIDDVMARVTRTLGDPDTETREGLRVLRDMSSRQNQTNLRILMGQREADQLLERIDQAATAFELRAAIATGSQTALRQNIQSGVQAQASEGIVRTLAAGEPINAVKRLTQALTGETAEARQLRQMGIYEEIATALTSIRGNDAQQALAIIQHAMRRERTLSEGQAQIIADALISGYASGVPATGALTDNRAMQPPR